MAYIKEPTGIDFVVDSTALTFEDKKKISEVIAYYKATGKKMRFKKATAKKHVAKSRKKKVSV